MVNLSQHPEADLFNLNTRWVALPNSIQEDSAVVKDSLQTKADSNNKRISKTSPRITKTSTACIASALRRT